MLPGRWSARSAPFSAITIPAAEAAAAAATTPIRVSPMRREAGANGDAASVTGNAPLEAAAASSTPTPTTVRRARTRRAQHVTSRHVSSRLRPCVRPSARPLRTSAVSSLRCRAMLRFVANAPQASVSFFPRFLLSLSSPPFLDNLRYRAPSFFRPTCEFTEFARTHARTHLLYVRAVSYPSLHFPDRRLQVGVPRVAHQESIPRSSSVAATRAFYAAIGALRWPSLECAQPHQS